jgi:hypothetical protein
LDVVARYVVLIIQFSFDFDFDFDFFFWGRGGLLFTLFLDGVAIPRKRSRSRRSRC